VANIDSLLRERVTLEVESIDRIYLNGYVPKLQIPAQLVAFLVKHRGNRLASPALLGRMTREWVAAVERFASEREIPLVRFGRGERKEQVARPHLEEAERSGRFGVVMVGVAQERATGFKGYRPKGAPPTFFDFCRASVFVNQFYFYILDRDFGPAFIKLSSYAPFACKVWLNGHEWAKRRAARDGIDFEALDNGFASASDPERLRAICAQLTERHIRRFFAYWMRQLPQPLTAADHAAGYRHELSILQLELSQTLVFERPLHGRQLFEEALLEGLALGRPDQLELVFARRITRRTPGRFSTRVVTRDTEPTLKLSYKHSSIRQYFKAGRALRTETTINDARDFGLGRRLHNLAALREVGLQANRRLLDVQRLGQRCALPQAILEELVLPSKRDGHPAPALRFGDPRVMALLRALANYRHLVEGLTNRSLRELVARELGRPYTARQMTHDLRRLRRNGLIERTPHKHRYTLTDLGRRVAIFFSKVHARIVLPGLRDLDSPLPDQPPRPLAQAWRRFTKALDTLVADAQLIPQT
jgi:DNA-binding transcriptional ArsR family regulator